MGANMQRQAVALLWGEAPLVCSGAEDKIAEAAGATVVAQRSGTATHSAGGTIRIRADENDTSGQLDEYQLRKLRRTEEHTCFDQRPLVSAGDRVEAGQPIAESSACEQGRLALGRNLLVGYLPWDGYNFEDAVVISDRLVKEKR